MTLKFSSRNTKLNCLADFLNLKKSVVVSFDVPAGYTCGKADICLTYAHPKTGKLIKRGRVTCYAAAGEVRFPNSGRAHWYNWMKILECGLDSSKIADLIEASLPKDTQIVRIHSSGDFKYETHPQYFYGWLEVARRHPEIKFFGYTKYLELAKLDKGDNFRLHYSVGSKDDSKFKKIANCRRPAACYIEEYDGQYPNIKKVCGTHAKGYEDYISIMAGETFKIGKH